MSLQVRPLEPADLAAAAAVGAAAFGIDITAEHARDRWRGRVAHALSTDSGGAFVAVRDGAIVGVAEALVRERLWCLSLLTVLPGVQSAGAGRALMERALEYAAGTDAGLIVSSSDPRALRLYGRSGFSLRPSFCALGTVARGLLPRPDAAIREGGPADLDALEAISREVRGAPHTLELRYALGRGATLLLIDGHGFAVAAPELGVWLLAARDDAAATALLWAALAHVADGVRARVGWITAEQGWAIDVALRAGLELTVHGALCIRGRPGPLRPFLPSAPFA
jgi:ribosomal protein S18 acetylase RimI-like enzyme